MATVVLTETRKQQIEHSVAAHLDKEWNDTVNKVDVLVPKFTDYVYNQIVPADVQKKIKDIPDSYFVKTDTFRIGLSVPGFDRIVQIKLKNRRIVSAEKTYGVTLVINKDFLTNNPNAPEPAQEAIQLMEHARALDVERTQLRQSIRKLLDACSTLQQLCKVFPTALNHVDENTRQIFNRRATKSEKVDLKEYLTDDLKSALVKSSIIQSSQAR